MTAALRAGVDAALDDLRPAFEADSFDLSLESLGDAGEVVIAVAARPEACLDCLVPEPMLGQIVDQAVRRHAPQVTRVTVVKRGFDAG